MASGPQLSSLSGILRRIAGSPRAGRFSPAALTLIATNLIPLYGVLVFGWAVFPIMVLFWLENVVIGVLNILRILLASWSDATRWAASP
jgi:TM2 domain-containing membrane protein YozV